MTNKTMYTDNSSKTAEFFRLTLAFLGKYKIQANPYNYQIAYEYVAGKNLELMNDFDEIIKISNFPDENQLKVLYKQYYLQNEDSLNKIRHEIKLIITNVMEEFNSSDANLSNYAQTLNQFSEILDSNESPMNLLEETNRVIKKTYDLEQSQHGVETKMTNVLAEIDNLRKELEQVKKESNTDALTAISNRKAFDSILQHSILSSRETQQGFCLLLLDIDHFKVFNDTYGHLVGDKVLRYVASSLKRSIKKTDFVARFGGEEFVIILPDSDINSAMVVAEQLRKIVSAGKLTDKGKNVSYGKTMVSIGVTQFRASDLSNEIVNRADKALYLAKDRGRNRVEKL